MNNRASAVALAGSSAKEATWRKIKPESLRSVRGMLIMKHGNLTKAAADLDINYRALSDTVNGRLAGISHIATIQNDLELNDSQVLSLWPQLRTWPRKVA